MFLGIEIKKIKDSMKKVMETENIDPNSINCIYRIGEYDNKTPGVIGCFKYKNRWFFYQTDDRLYMSVNGPVSFDSIRLRMIQSLPLSKEQMKKYDNYADDELEAMFTSYNSYQDAINNYHRK